MAFFGPGWTTRLHLGVNLTRKSSLYDVTARTVLSVWVFPSTRRQKQKNTRFRKNIKDVFSQNTKLPPLNKQKKSKIN
jgi:hypothetical protein